MVASKINVTAGKVGIQSQVLDTMLTGLVLAILLMLATPVRAQDSAGQDLGQAANDPTASLASFQVQNIYVSDYHNLDNESGNTVLLRGAVPFNAFGLSQIGRVSLPVITDSPSGESGLGDATVFDLVTFEKSWGRWGIGPVLLAPTASEDELGSEKWAAGPAIGFVASGQGMLWGLFNQNLFSFAGDDDREDVNISILQPIFNMSLGNGWSVGTSDMSITYSWEESDWVSIPVGVSVTKLVTIGSQPVQFVFSYEHNLADDYIVPEDTFNVTAKFLFPL